MVTPASGGPSKLSDGALLDVEDVRVELPGADGRPTPILRRVSFALGRREAVGLVGASGSGKSLTALSILGLLPPQARVTGGRIRFDGIDLRRLPDRPLRAIRGGRIGYVPQEPATAFNPVWSIGLHLREAIRLHPAGARRVAPVRAAELLRLAELDDVPRMLRSFPHQLSSGQRQRAFLAIALAAAPDLLIADEPTSALDARVQREILATLRRLRQELRLAVLLISHDPAAVAAVCDRVLVMRDGEIVDDSRPRPRAAGRIGSRPADTARPQARGRPAVSDLRSTDPPLLEARGLVKHYSARGRRGSRRSVEALRGVSLHLHAGECLAVVGESGSGKSTLARCLARLIEPTSGSVTFAGDDLTTLRSEPLRRSRRYLQMIFADAGASLDPRMRVATILEEPLRAFALGSRGERRDRVLRTMERLGLSLSLARRFPGELSGGQRQRVAFGRAVIVHPRVLLADEPVSALDPPLQAQALELLNDLRVALGLGLLLIAHDLALVSRLADRLLVLDRGRVVEQGRTCEILRAPRHPQTAALVAAASAQVGDGTFRSETRRRG